MTSLENVEFVNFIDDTGTEIPVSYDIIVKWSGFVKAIEWDNNEVKEVPILSIPEYPKSTVASHLTHILSHLKLDAVGTLKEVVKILEIADDLETTKSLEVSDVSVNTKDLEISRVSGNISNLRIYLLLCVWLGLTAYIQEIASTLQTYDLDINTELEIYLDICEGILRNPLQSFRNVFRLLTEADTIYLDSQGQTTATLEWVLRRIIENPEFNEYDRYMLARRYDLKLPNVSIITARRLYNQGIITEIIKPEIPLIESTKDVIADSVVNKSRAVRIALEDAPNKGLFWLYCDEYYFSPEKNHIYCGTMTINNQQRNLIIYGSLFSISELESKYYDNFEYGKSLWIPHEAYRSHLEGYHLYVAVQLWDQSDLVKYTSQQFMQAENMDAQFRKWLNDRNMLTDIEVEMLNELLHLQKELDTREKKLSSQNQIILNNTTLTLTGALDNSEAQLVDQVLKLFRKKLKYYSQDEIIALEKSRQQLRENFFYSSRNYGGIVIILKIFSIHFYDDDNIIINPYRYKHTKSIYHTHTLPSPKLLESNFIGIISELPQYFIQSPYTDMRKNYVPYSSSDTRKTHHLKFDISTYNDNLYKPNTILITLKIRRYPDEELPEIEITVYHEIEHSQLQNAYPKETLRLIDESTIPNLQEVKEKSNIKTGKNKVLTLAYPSNNPLIYVQAGIETTPPTPYLWYHLYDSIKLYVIFRSETQNLDPKEG